MYCLAYRINIEGKGTQRLGSDAISNLLDRQPAGDLSRKASSRCHYFCQAHGYLPSFSAHCRWPVLIITSPAGEDAKYCDEYVSLCVCLSAKISPEPLAPTLAKIFVHDAYVRGSVLLRHVEDRPHRLSAGRGDGSAERGRSVIYDCLVYTAL